MEPADLRARGRLLDGIPGKWASPPKRTKKIPVLKPEQDRMEAGDVFAYPTVAANPDKVPLGTLERDTYRFEPDAENTFVCARRARVFHDLEARYFIVPLMMFHMLSPAELEDCIDAMLISETGYKPNGRRQGRPSGSRAKRKIAHAAE